MRENSGSGIFALSFAAKILLPSTDQSGECNKSKPGALWIRQISKGNLSPKA